MFMAEVDTGEQAVSGSEEQVKSFFAEEERILNDIAGASGFTFRRGNQWAINPETGEATYDPKFFEEKGYTPSQSLFGAFHEIKCHLVETAELLSTQEGQKAWEALKRRERERRWLHTWENWRTDLKGNHAILNFTPSLMQDVERLYQEKLWPTTDFTNEPKHLQFIDAVLREGMLPDESVRVHPEVREAINKLKNIKGKDVIALSTDPTLDPLLALRLSQRYIEPVIEELYQEDLKDRKNQEPKKGKKGKESVESGEPFGEEYAEHENKHPEPMDEEEVEKKIKEAIEQQSESARQTAGYEVEHGVSKKDVAEYQQEYRFVEQYIEPLREIFRRIVEQRIIQKRRLAGLKEEGVMIDPGLVAQTYLDVQAGVESPKTMKDFEGRFIEENIPGKFSVRLVADQSGSMEGPKSVAQRRSAILVMEALREFQDLLEEEGPNIYPELNVQTELRSFGVPEGTRLYKPLSPELSERQRIDYFKGLLETAGGTNDFDALADIEKDVRDRIASDPAYVAELQGGKRREIVIVFTDGDSGVPPKVQQRVRELRNLGVKVVGLGMTADARPILTTYAPDARICYDVGDLPKTLQEMLAEYLGTLSITGRPEDLLQRRE